MVFVKIVNSNFQPLVGGTRMARVVVNICGLNKQVGFWIY